MQYAVCPGESYLTSLGLNSLVWEAGIITLSTERPGEGFWSRVTPEPSVLSCPEKSLCLYLLNSSLLGMRCEQ